MSGPRKPESLKQRLRDDELRKTREWCASREADKPWYTEFGDSPKLLTKCDFMIALIDEVLASRATNKQEGAAER